MIFQKHTFSSNLLRAITAVSLKIWNNLLFWYLTSAIELHHFLNSALIFSLIFLIIICKVIVTVPDTTMAIIFLAFFIFESLAVNYSFIAVITSIYLNILFRRNYFIYCLWRWSEFLIFLFLAFRASIDWAFGAWELVLAAAVIARNI